MGVEIINCEQGTPEWFEARKGIPTASCFSKILAKGEGKTRATYMRELAAEIITGEIGESFTSKDMERGKIMEAEARERYAFETENEPVQVGFLRNGKKGCSPDSLVDAMGGLEIKTKRADILIDVLQKDVIPSEHVAQLQGFLWVAERDWIDFVAYWPKMPMFRRRVFRDEAYIRALALAVDQFNVELEELVERIQGLGMREAA